MPGRDKKPQAIIRPAEGSRSFFHAHATPLVRIAIQPEPG
jgi:hypothetical protein